METKQDVSYGIIPVRQVDSQWEVFLIHQFSRIGNNSYWVFPKGHPEKDESPEQTARRELKEETDMTVGSPLMEQTFTLSYDFMFEGTKIEKTVIFFIGLIANEHYQLNNEEVKEAGWYSLAEASKRLDYNDTKKMFKEVCQFLKTKTAG